MDIFLSFAKDRGCLIISPGFTQPWPWRLAPSTYRLYPADHLYKIPLAKAMESIDIKKSDNSAVRHRLARAHGEEEPILY